MIVTASDFALVLGTVTTWATSIAPGLLTFVAGLAGLALAAKKVRSTIKGG